MDAATVVSLVLGIVSIVLALVAIAVTFIIYDRTKDVLSDISEKAAAIETTVSGTQTKLVDTVTEIAKPQKETQEEMLMRTLLPEMMKNPDLLERFVRLGNEQQG